MPEITPRLDLISPIGSDQFLRSDFQTNWAALDAAPGVLICTSSSHPNWQNQNAAIDQEKVGRLILEEDTGNLLEYQGGGVFAPPNAADPQARAAAASAQSSGNGAQTSANNAQTSANNAQASANAANSLAQGVYNRLNGIDVGGPYSYPGYPISGASPDGNQVRDAILGAFKHAEDSGASALAQAQAYTNNLRTGFGFGFESAGGRNIPSGAVDGRSVSATWDMGFGHGGTEFALGIANVQALGGNQGSAHMWLEYSYDGNNWGVMSDSEVVVAIDTGAPKYVTVFGVNAIGNGGLVHHRVRITPGNSITLALEFCYGFSLMP